MKKILLLIPSILSAQQVVINMNTQGCPSDSVQVLAYLPPGTTNQVFAIPTCVRLGPGLAITNGVLNTTSSQLKLKSKIDRYPVSMFAPFPTDGSDKVIEVLTSKTPAPDSAIIGFVTGTTIQNLNADNTQGSNNIQVIIGPDAYNKPGTEIVLVYFYQEP